MSKTSLNSVDDQHVVNAPALLDIFRKEIQDKNLFDATRHTDMYLYKFLRARKYNIAKTMDMFVKCEEWRMSMNATSLISFKLEKSISKQLQAIYPRFYHKTSKTGTPIYVEIYKHLDPKKLTKIVDEETILKEFICSYELLARKRIPACSEKFGRNVEFCISILDAGGVSVLDALSMINLVRKVIAISNNYYPEMLEKMFIINTSMFLRGAAYTLIAFADEATKNKITVLGNDYKKYLLEYINEEDLPTFFGGTCKCPGGCKHSDAGPWNVKMEPADHETDQVEDQEQERTMEMKDEQ